MVTVCSTTRDYVPKMEQFLTTLNAFGIGRRVVFCVGFKPDECQDEFQKFPNLEFMEITPEENWGAPEGTNSIQHGSFVQKLGDIGDELIIYSDADIIVQRPLTWEEQGWLETFGNNDVGVSWNSGPEEKLIDEAYRLRPRGKNPDYIVSRYGDIVRFEPCFNIGVLIARKSVWERMYEEYKRLYTLAVKTFEHRARQQWLMCYVMATLGISRHILPYEIHTHAHYGLPEALYSLNNVACYQGKIVAFRHRF